MSDIEKLLFEVGQARTAILCSEEDPAHCHRQNLIVQHLMDTKPDIQIHHIRGDGSLSLLEY